MILVAYYERWGERCPEKILGGFASVIWDRRRQALFCPHDPLGVEPFYCYRSGRALVFAPEIKALLCAQEVSHRLNEVRVGDYLAEISEDKSTTFYRGIPRFPSAHSMSVVRGEVSVWPYWSLDPSHVVRLWSDEEYAEALRELFAKAVRCRLPSAFPICSCVLAENLQGGSVVKSVPMCNLEKPQSLPAPCDLTRLVEEDLAQTIKQDLVSSRSS